MQNSILKFNRASDAKIFSWSKGKSKDSLRLTDVETVKPPVEQQVVPILSESRQIVDAQIRQNGQFFSLLCL